MTGATAAQEDRISRARAALARAELRTGARSQPASPSPAPALPLPPEARRSPLLLTDRPPLPVPTALTPLLPDGLRRGGTAAVLGSTSLVLALLAAACAGRETWVAVVGQPGIGLLATAQAGVALDRLAVVPHPGADAAPVIAALLDGVDIVLVGPEVALGDADRRRLSSRARERGSVLLSSMPWPGAGTVLTVEGGRWTGVGEGDGRLRAHELRVTRTGRGGAARPQTVELVLPYTGPVGTDPYGIGTCAVTGPAATGTSTETAATTGTTGATPPLRLVG